MAVRALRSLSFTLRLLLISIVIYNITRFLPSDRSSKIRMKRAAWGARKIAAFFLRQGGLYIKAAQYMATISNLFDTEFTEIFGRVNDTGKSRSYEKVRYRFLAEFGTDPEDLYLEFDRKPLAAASLGQVHAARLKDGRKVAVKFLHPGIESNIRTDLRALRYAVRLIRWFYRDLDFRGHLSEFATMILSEIDYENEAENMRRARESFANDPRIVIPEVISELSRSTVLTTEFLNGIPIDEIQALDAANVDRRAVTELLLESYARMIFEDRFYHADPHPGNIFVLTSDQLNPVRLGFVDFGASQFITERTFNVLRRFMETLGMRDIQAVVELSQETGLLHADADRENYINLAEFIYARYASFKLEESYRINPIRFGRMVKLQDLNWAGLRLRDIIRDVQPPRKYIYLARTITMVISLAMHLDSKINIFTVAKPHLEAYLQPRPRRILDYLRIRNIASALERLVNNRAVQIKQPESKHLQIAGVRLLYRLGQQTLVASLAAGGIWMHTYLETAGRSNDAQYALYGGLAFLAIFLWKIMKSGVQDR